MLIDPKVKSIVIFNGGGGIVEREMKLTVQQGIKDSDKKFQHLFETSPNAIIISNFAGTIIDCNSATYNVFKYKKEDLVGKKFLQIMTLPSSTLSILHNVYEQLIKGQDVEQSEIQGYNKEGKLIWVSYAATLIRLHDEILIQVIAQDITEEKLRGDT